MTVDVFDFSTPIEERKRDQLYRAAPSALEGPQGVEVDIDGRRYSNFCSNDYLGLANHPKVIEAFKRGADQYGVGSGASHYVIGHSAAHHELEEALADHCGRSKVLLFSSGYMANVGVINALTKGATSKNGDTVYQDKLNHASLIDGGLITAAKLRRYPHNDVDRLQKLLCAQERGRALVVSDGVFSMDGDIAPLEVLSECCETHKALLMVDDAHGVGVLGARGEGSVSALGLSSKQVPVYMATLGKALGTFGAFVAGDTEVIDYLRQFARTAIYTTAMPPAVAVAALAALKLAQEEPWRREHLQHLVQQFRDGMQRLGMAEMLMPSSSAIQPVVLGESDLALKCANDLKVNGIIASAIRPPTVPQGSARIRFTFSASHTTEQVDALLDVLSTSVIPQLQKREAT